ncbi:hypothetical protein MTsPCn5_16600 [Croceitalea sp. MTPC5]|uniref:hypothetical protein n=1 Tax=Croceitalea sp. MTPC5 TaxID=3056565 RepID=UPI002B3913FD|nr:hypothetical protein MTsPCn5_16600 [Croceitalea sp. MTPC5]
MKYINQIFKILKKESPILYSIVMLFFSGAVACLVALAFDDRQLAGINVWIKPFKFLISTAIYVATVGYLITFYPYSTLKKNSIRNIVSWTLLLELGIIVYQAARGVPSHYNGSTAFDAMLFAGMGILIGINVLIMVLFIIDTIRLKLALGRPVQFAILIGWIVVFFGSWIGGTMISQMAHNVGVADGGDGLPLLNWSTVAGDLRIAHFFGLHGIQLIPLFAFWIGHKWNIKKSHQLRYILLFGLFYSSWIAFTFYQAKSGIPLIRL